MAPTGTKRTSRQKAAPYDAITVLAQPGTDYVTIKGETFLIRGRKHAHLNQATREILLAQHWIEEGIPMQIMQGMITDNGRDAAKQLEEMRRSYHQMDLWLPDSNSTNF